MEVNNKPLTRCLRESLVVAGILLITFGIVMAALECQTAIRTIEESLVRMVYVTELAQQQSSRFETQLGIVTAKFTEQNQVLRQRAIESNKLVEILHAQKAYIQQLAGTLEAHNIPVPEYIENN